MELAKQRNRLEELSVIDRIVNNRALKKVSQKGRTASHRQNPSLFGFHRYHILLQRTGHNHQQILRLQEKQTPKRHGWKAWRDPPNLSSAFAYAPRSDSGVLVGDMKNTHTLPAAQNTSTAVIICQTNDRRNVGYAITKGIDRTLA